jgi:flagellar biosynthesis protein FliR
MKKKLNAKVWIAISGIVIAVVAQFLPDHVEFATEIMTLVGIGLTGFGIFDTEEKDEV